MRFLALAVLLAGCASSSDLARPRIDIGLLEEDTAFRGAGVGIEKPGCGPRVSEEQIREALGEAPPLEGPAKIGIVEIRRDGAGYAPVSVAPEELDAFRTALGETAGAVRAIPQIFLPPQADLPALRYAAARIGCDSVFVFGRGENSDVYFNGWSNLNWFIIPVFVVPGKTVEVYAAAEGALVDVRSGRVRAVSAADARRDRDIASSSTSERPLSEVGREAQMEAVKALGGRLALEMGASKVGRK